MEYETTLIEQITLPKATRPTGGKSALLALHDFYRRRGDLKQDTKSGSKFIVFFADRDYDHLSGKMRRRCEHIIYTERADVEAEVHQHGNLARAISSTLSLSMAESRTAANAIGDPVAFLAAQRDWIELCCIAECLKARCGVKPSGASRVHTDAYGPLDPVALRTLTNDVRQTARTPHPVGREKQIRGRVERIYRKDSGRSLVKGKLTTALVCKKLEGYYRGAPVRSRDIRVEALSRALLDSVDFSKPWTEYWLRQIRTLAR